MTSNSTFLGHSLKDERRNVFRRLERSALITMETMMIDAMFQKIENESANYDGDDNEQEGINRDVARERGFLK